MPTAADGRRRLLGAHVPSTTDTDSVYSKYERQPRIQTSRNRSTGARSTHTLKHVKAPCTARSSPTLDQHTPTDRSRSRAKATVRSRPKSTASTGSTAKSKSKQGRSKNKCYSISIDDLDLCAPREGVSLRRQLLHKNMITSNIIDLMKAQSSDSDTDSDSDDDVSGLSGK